MHSSLNSTSGDRSQVPKLPPQSTSTFWKVAYASCGPRPPTYPGGTRYRDPARCGDHRSLSLAGRPELAETRAWLEEQTAYTRAYLDAIPSRELIRGQVKELLAIKGIISEPWNVGERYFFLKRQNVGEQPVIVMRDGLFGLETVLIDPALRANGHSTAVAIAGDFPRRSLPCLFCATRRYRSLCLRDP